MCMGRHVPVKVFLIALIVCLPLLLAAVAQAGAPGPGDNKWTNVYTAGGKADAFLDVARGPGDVVYCTGITRATEETSTLLVVKYKAGGKLAWARTYKAPGRVGSQGSAVRVDGDGNVIVAGSIGQAPSVARKGRDIVVLKFDADGGLLWIRTYDGPAARDDYAVDLALDGKGAAYVVGPSRGTTTGYDYALVAVKPNGKLAWTLRYAGPKGKDLPTAVAVDGGGNSYVTGISAGNGGVQAAATLKVSHKGVRVWGKRLQFGEGYTAAEDLVFRNVGGSRELYLTGGALGLMSSKMNLLVARLHANTGTTVFHDEIDMAGDDDRAYALAVNAAGEAFAAGTTYDATNSIDHGIVVKVAADGSVPWTFPYTYLAATNETMFQTIAVDASGNSYAGGYGVAPGLEAEFLVVSVDRAGLERWVNYSSGSASGTDICRSLVVRSTALYAVGQVTRTRGGIDGLLKKIVP